MHGIESGAVFFIDDEAHTTPTDVGEFGFEMRTDFGEHLRIDLG